MYVDLKKKGIPWQGDINALPEIQSVDPRRAIDKGGVWYIWISLFERIVIERGDIVHRGGYGTLTKCLRRMELWNPEAGIWETKSSKSAFLKESSKQFSFKEEAVLQHVASTALKDAGFSNAVPPVLDIFISPHDLTVFTMECCDDCEILSTSLNDGSVTEKTLICVLFQVTFYLQVLERSLGLNHRDIKTSNILICREETSRSIASTSGLLNCVPQPTSRYVYEFGGFKWSIEKDANVILVDFGFSCLGLMMGKPSLIKAGIYYNARDPCPKIGRDLYLFMSLLLRDLYRLEGGKGRVVHFLERRISLENMDVPGFIKKYSDKEPDWLYFLTGDSSLVFPHCEPAIVLQSLAIAFPEWISEVAV
jgi:serine/threonine protein kinase